MIIVCIRGDHLGDNGRFKRVLPSLRLCLVLRYHQKPEDEMKHTGLVSWCEIHLPVTSFLMKTASGVTWVALITFHRAIFDFLKIVAAVGAIVQPERQFYWKTFEFQRKISDLPQPHSSPPSPPCKQGTWRDTARGWSWCRIGSCLMSSYSFFSCPIFFFIFSWFYLKTFGKPHQTKPTIHQHRVSDQGCGNRNALTYYWRQPQTHWGQPKSPTVVFYL